MAANRVVRALIREPKWPHRLIEVSTRVSRGELARFEQLGDGDPDEGFERWIYARFPQADPDEAGQGPAGAGAAGAPLTGRPRPH